MWNVGYFPSKKGTSYSNCIRVNHFDVAGYVAVGGLLSSDDTPYRSEN
jgi:hypothetical protein